MIDVQGLSARYRARAVITGLDCQMQRGQVTVLLGPNGAGKSTLLKCLAGINPLAAGTVLVDHVPLTHLPPRIRAQRLGYVEQNGRCFWNMTVREVVALGRLPFATRPAADDHAIDGALAATATDSLAHRRVHDLSGGEQARVLLARVLAGQPDWILADEPLANLDPAFQFDVLELFQAHARSGGGVVLVLHDIGLAARYADQIILMRAGQIVACGTPTDVITTATLADVYGVSADVRTGPHGISVALHARQINNA